MARESGSDECPQCGCGSEAVWETAGPDRTCGDPDGSGKRAPDGGVEGARSAVRPAFAGGKSAGGSDDGVDRVVRGEALRARRFHATHEAEEFDAGARA